MKRLLSLLLLLSSFAAGAQDKIYVKTQKQPIVGIVTEVGTTEVKYHLVDRLLPILTIDKQDIIRIQFESGQNLQFSDPSKDFNLYYDQHLWNAKVSLLSPINGHTQLFLENAVKPGYSREFELNIIGLGADPTILENNRTNQTTGKPFTYEARGLGIGHGMRFIRMPDYLGTATRLRHLMQGSYIKPSLSLSYYTRNFVTDNYISSSQPYVVERKPVFAALAAINFGRQWILNNVISIDAYALIGMGYDNVRSTQEKFIQDVSGGYSTYTSNIPYNAFGYTRFSKSDVGVGFGAGIRVGFLFDWKAKTKTTVEK